MEVVTTSEIIASMLAYMAIGLGGTLFVLGLITIFDTQQRRLNRAKRKFKRENEQFNK